jgi:hypothetical protein
MQRSSGHDAGSSLCRVAGKTHDDRPRCINLFSAIRAVSIIRESDMCFILHVKFLFHSHINWSSSARLTPVAIIVSLTKSELVTKSNNWHCLYRSLMIISVRLRESKRDRLQVIREMLT